jgi:hypothetical protein
LADGHIDPDQTGCMEPVNVGLRMFRAPGGCTSLILIKVIGARGAGFAVPSWIVSERFHGAPRANLHRPAEIYDGVFGMSQLVRFIVEANISRYREMLSGVIDDERRSVIQRLLDEEAAKLERLNEAAQDGAAYGKMLEEKTAEDPSDE